MDAGTIIIALATVVTGLATCVSAYVAWEAWRGRLAAEWEWSWSGLAENRHLEVVATIINETSTTLQAGVFETDKALIHDVLAGNPPRAKHESWPANIAPLNTDIGPHKRQGFRIVVLLNWSALAAVTPRRWLRKSKSDVLLRSQVTVVSRSARRWKRKFKAQITIPREMIEAAAVK